MADALHHNLMFTRWCSEYVEDMVFGANYNFFQTDLRGENTFVNPPFNEINGQDILTKVIDRCLELMNTQLPTRLLLIIPVFQGLNGDRFLRRALNCANSIVVMHFPVHTFSFDPPDTYYLENARAAVFNHEVAVVLMCSRSSLLWDPIDWDWCSKKMKTWATEKKIPVNIPVEHSPLAMFVHPRSVPRSIEHNLKREPLLTLVPWTEKGRVNKFTLSLSHRIDFKKAKACSDLMKADYLLVAAGIFPTSIKNLFSKGQEVVERWSVEVFWCIFRMWNRRSQLHYAQSKVATKIDLQTNCNSPFHFLTPAVPSKYICECPKEPVWKEKPDESQKTPLLTLLESKSKEEKMLDSDGDNCKDGKTSAVGLRRSERLKRRLPRSAVAQKRGGKRTKTDSSAQSCEKGFTARRKRRK